MIIRHTNLPAIDPMNSLRTELSRSLGKELVHTDELTLMATSADAGCYRKVPKIVLKPQQEKQVVDALKILHAHNTPLTFRAAGTSLSGQAISDSVLLQARGDHWKGYEIIDEGRLIRAQPGITGTRLNQLLAHTGMKFGPDPASINSAMVGGIIANNASGMSCGIHANSYATIQSARIIFADGSLLDTADPASREAFLKSHSELVDTGTAGGRDGHCSAKRRPDRRTHRRDLVFGLEGPDAEFLQPAQFVEDVTGRRDRVRAQNTSLPLNFAAATSPQASAWFPMML